MPSNKFHPIPVTKCIVFVKHWSKRKGHQQRLLRQLVRLHAARHQVDEVCGIAFVKLPSEIDVMYQEHEPMEPNYITEAL